jgi:drug/metabolite transporter (DMT)-like permease
LASEVVGLVLAFTAGILFGAADVLIRAASVKLTPLANTLISLVVGTPMLWVAALVLSEVELELRAALLYALAGLANFVAGRLLLYTAISYAGAATAAVAASPTVVVASLMAWPLLGEELGAAEALGVCLVALAVYLASTKPSGEPLHGGTAAKGVALGLAASLLFAISTILVRQASGYERASPLTGLAVSYTAALPVVASLAAKRRSTVSLRLWSRYHAYAVLAAVTVTLAQLSRYGSLALTRVAEATVLMSLLPLHTVAFSAILPGVRENPRLRHVVAAGLAVAGVALTVSF